MLTFDFSGRIKAMGIQVLPLIGFFLLPITFPSSLKASSDSTVNKTFVQPIEEKLYKAILDRGEIDEMDKACNDAKKFSLDSRLRELSNRIEATSPTPLEFDIGLRLGNVLLTCQAPEIAQEVLLKIQPRNELEKNEWLVLSWKAANAALDHHSASSALRSLVNGDLTKLDKETLVIGYKKDGSPINISALDLLAEHEISVGLFDSAAKVLMAGREKGVKGARRLVLAVQLMEPLSRKDRIELFQSAISQASEDKAWWMVSDILRLQLIINFVAGEDSVEIREQFKNLAESLDDNYSLLEVFGNDKSKIDEVSLLESRLNSSRKTDYQ